MMLCNNIQNILNKISIFLSGASICFFIEYNIQSFVSMKKKEKKTRNFYISTSIDYM